MEQFSKDIDTLIFIQSYEKKIYYIRNNIHNHIDDPLYFSGLFVMINTDYDKLSSVFPLILNAYDNIGNICIFLRNLMNKSVKLNDLSRMLITKLVFSSRYLKDFIKFSTFQAKTTAKEEQINGVFCLMFMATRMTPKSTFDDIQKILLNRQEIFDSLLKYFGRIAEMNYPYVDCDEQKCYTDCSNDDFNIFIIDTTMKICKETPDIVSSKTFEDVIGKIINNLFMSKMRIRNVLISKRLEFSNSNQMINAVDMITDSINRLEESMNNIEYIDFNKKYIGDAVDDIESPNKLENLCWFVAQYFKTDTDINYIKGMCIGDCLISYLETIKNNSLPISSVMAVGLVLDKLEYVLDENKALGMFNEIALTTIAQLEKTNWVQVVKNTNGFLLLIKNIMESIKKTNFISTKEMECINNNINQKCDQYLYLDIIYIYHKQNTNNNTYADADVQQKCIKMICTFLENCITSDTSISETCISKIKEILVTCKLSRLEINKIKIRFGNKFPFIKELLENSLTLLDRTRDKIKDYFFTEKIIENPVFVSLCDYDSSSEEIIIDESTLEEDIFKKYIENKTTIDDIKKYNKLPKYINKRIEFMTILGIHKHHKDN